MLRKRKFRELKTADEENAVLEKSAPKSTDDMSQIFAQWQNASLTKQAANEEAGFDLNGTKPKV